MRRKKKVVNNPSTFKVGYFQEIFNIFYLNKTPNKF